MKQSGGDDGSEGTHSGDCGGDEAEMAMVKMADGGDGISRPPFFSFLCFVT